MENYYLCSEEVVKQFPGVIKSKPFKSGYSFSEEIHKNYYVVKICEDTYSLIEMYYHSKSEDEIGDFWIWEIVDSHLTLEKNEVDLTEYGQGLYTPDEITLEDCQLLGLFVAIEESLDVTKENNRAFALYKLSQKYKTDPISFVNQL